MVGADKRRLNAAFLVNPASANGATGKRWPKLRARAAEILTGPGGKDRQLDARARDPVDDLVQRSVAADDDEQVVS